MGIAPYVQCKCPRCGRGRRSSHHGWCHSLFPPNQLHIGTRTHSQDPAVDELMEQTVASCHHGQLSLTTQVAPFRQGSGVQSSMLRLQVSPVQPSGQRQLKALISSLEQRKHIRSNHDQKKLSVTTYHTSPSIAATVRSTVIDVAVTSKSSPSSFTQAWIRSHQVLSMHESEKIFCMTSLKLRMFV